MPKQIKERMDLIIAVLTIVVIVLAGASFMFIRVQDRLDKIEDKMDLVKDRDELKALMLVSCMEYHNKIDK